MQAVEQLGVADLRQMLESDGILLLDVRTDAEVARGLIRGARHIPLHQLPARAGELGDVGCVVVYCQSGGRSAQACAWLQAQGFERVYNLHGGVLAWVREGNDLVDPQ